MVVKQGEAIGPVEAATASELSQPPSLAGAPKLLRSARCLRWITRVGSSFS